MSKEIPVPSLTRPRAEVEQKLHELISQAETMRVDTFDAEVLDEKRSQRWEWNSYVEVYLKKVFSDGSLAEEFNPPLIFAGGSNRLDDQIKEHNADLEFNIRTLKSIVRRLELFDHGETPAPIGGPGAVRTNKVFLVHGRDEVTKEKVSKFLKDIGIELVVLSERTNRGVKAVIEKVEANADVLAAVVLLTPDDLGGLATDDPATFTQRPRMNVVFELGYFIGKLGREKVFAVGPHDVPGFSDFAGVLTIPFEEDWQNDLASELDKVGVQFDLHRRLKK